MSHQEHRDAAPESVGCAVITVSDTRDPTTDKSGQLIKDLLAENGHEVVYYTIVRDSPRQIKGELAILGEKGSCRAIILNGGTGISPRDTTFDAVTGILDKRLDGFGEIFRYLDKRDEAKGKEGKDSDAGKDKDSEDGQKDSKVQAEEVKLTDDQLKRAIELLKSWAIFQRVNGDSNQLAMEEPSSK